MSPRSNDLMTLKAAPSAAAPPAPSADSHCRCPRLHASHFSRPTDHPEHAAAGPLGLRGDGGLDSRSPLCPALAHASSATRHIHEYPDHDHERRPTLDHNAVRHANLLGTGPSSSSCSDTTRCCRSASSKRRAAFSFSETDFSSTSTRPFIPLRCVKILIASSVLSSCLMKNGTSVVRDLDVS